MGSRTRTNRFMGSAQSFEETFHLTVASVDGLKHLRQDPKICILDAILRTHYSLATNPRDKIFGLLGIASDSEKYYNSEERPSYSSSVEEVWMKLTKQMLSPQPSMELIMMKSCKPQPKSAEYGFPSWMPDWLDIADTGILGRRSLLAVQQFTRQYKAVNSHGPVFQYRGNLMKVLAYMFDVIDGLGGLADWDASNPARTITQQASGSAQSKNPYQKPWHLVNALWMSLSFDKESTGIMRQCFAAFWILQMIAWMDRHEPGLSRWLESNNELLIHGRTLSQWATQPQYRPTSLRNLLNWAIGGPHDIRENIAQHCLRIYAPTAELNRRVMVTSKGYVGMAPPQARSGDQICVLLGCNIPIILRQRHPDYGTYQVIGESYVHGLMKGEIWKNVKSPFEDLILS